MFQKRTLVFRNWFPHPNVLFTIVQTLSASKDQTFTNYLNAFFQPFDSHSRLAVNRQPGFCQENSQSFLNYTFIDYFIFENNYRFIMYQFSSFWKKRKKDFEFSNTIFRSYDFFESRNRYHLMPRTLHSCSLSLLKFSQI